MRASRVVITAATPGWARQAAASMTGFATSINRLQVRGGDRARSAGDRHARWPPGCRGCCFATDSESLQKRLVERVGQDDIDVPYDRLLRWPPRRARRTRVGSALRIFGDGYQASKVVGGRRYWRIPVMDGEFLIQEDFGRVRGSAEAIFHPWRDR